MTDVALAIPSVGTPIVDPTGQINEVWFRFFYTLLQRTGGTEGDDLARLARAVALLASRFVSAQSIADSVVAIPYRAIVAPPDAVPVQRAPAALSPEPVASTRTQREDAPGPVSNHGQQQDGGLHAVADANNNGFMSAADKAKLDSMTNDSGDWARVAKASLPAAQASRIGWKRFVTDATGATGIVPAYCDGTAWKRFADDSVVN